MALIFLFFIALKVFKILEKGVEICYNSNVVLKTKAVRSDKIVQKGFR